MFGMTQRIGLGDSPVTEDMSSSIETEKNWNSSLMQE
jgi:hypothetical protein